MPLQRRSPSSVEPLSKLPDSARIRGLCRRSMIHSSQEESEEGRRSFFIAAMIQIRLYQHLTAISELNNSLSHYIHHLHLHDKRLVESLRHASLFSIRAGEWQFRGIETRFGRDDGRRWHDDIVGLQLTTSTSTARTTIAQFRWFFPSLLGYNGKATDPTNLHVEECLVEGSDVLI